MCKKELFENKAVAYHEYLQQAFMAKRVYRIFIFISDNLTMKNIDKTLDPLLKPGTSRVQILFQLEMGLLVYLYGSNWKKPKFKL